MMKRIYIILIIAVVTSIYVRCKQPYLPPASSTNNSYLVVEGNINTGNDSTIITLSRTVKLTDTVSSKPELNATVVVNVKLSTGIYGFPLTDIGGGKYAAPYLNLPSGISCQLEITTSGNKKYQSDFVPAKNSPPIDSLSFEIKSNGVQVYSNTHDPNNNTRYYRWDYKETWMIHSQYQSDYKAVTTPVNNIVIRSAEDDIYFCWVSGGSSTIIVNSSAKLAQDVIAHNPVAFVQSNSPKLSQEYSVLIYQYALTKEAFDYWQNLKKNTEQLGSIFDAQPSQITGNIHSEADPSEPVIGYISAGIPSQKRLFIGYSSFPQVWLRTVLNPYDECIKDTLSFYNPKTGENEVERLYEGREIPIQGIFDLKTNKLVGFSASSPFCVDCRFRGTNKRPSFWIDKF